MDLQGTLSGLLPASVTGWFNPNGPTPSPATPSPAQVQQQQMMAQQLMQEGSQTTPIQSGWQGAARLAQGLIGGYDSAQATKADTDARANSAALSAQLLNGGDTSNLDIPATPGYTSPTLTAADAQQDAAQDASDDGTPAQQKTSANLPMFAASQGTPTSATPNVSTALNFYRQMGLSPVAAAGLVGGFTTESGKALNTTAVDPGDGSDGSNSVGIGQWNGQRAKGLMSFAQANGLDPSALNTQLKYSWAELNGPEKGTLNALQQAQTPQQATAAALGYERPAGWSPQNPLGANTAPQRLAATSALSGGFGPIGTGSPAAQPAVYRVPPNGFGPLATGQSAPLPAVLPSAPAPQAPGFTPFNGSQIGPGTTSFSPSPQAPVNGIVPPPGAASMPAVALGNAPGMQDPTSAARGMSGQMLAGPGSVASSAGLPAYQAPAGVPPVAGAPPVAPAPMQQSVVPGAVQPPQPPTAPAQQVAATRPPQASPAQPYGSQPLNIGGRMLTRQQAEDTDGLDHSDYDAVAQKLGMTPTPFVDAGAAPGAPSPASSVVTGSAVPGAPDIPQSPAAQSAAGAGAPASAAPAQNPQGVDRSALLAILNDPYSTPAMQQIAGSILQNQLTPKATLSTFTDKDGSVWQKNSQTGELKLVQDNSASDDAWKLQDVNGQPIEVNSKTGETRSPAGIAPQAKYSTYTDAAGNVHAFNPANPGQNVELPGGAPGAGKFGVIGEDEYGRKLYGYPPAPPAPGAAPAPAATQSSAGALTPDLINTHGTDFLGKIAATDPGMASQVQGIVEGRLPYPSGMLLKTPYGQTVATYVTQTDPTFEAGNSAARIKTRNEFETGGPSSPAGMITAGNTAIQHLGHLSDAAEALGNADSGIPGNNLYNAAGNAIDQAAGRGTAVTQFNNIAGKYVEEATKFYRGAGGTESDIQRDLGNLSPSMSPTQLHAAIQTQVNLLQSKVNALQDRWHQGMGPLVPDFPIIQPESAAALTKINARANGTPVPHAGGPTAPIAAPPQAIADLKANATPQMRAHFDQVFGSGAADKAIGGQ